MAALSRLVGIAITVILLLGDGTNAQIRVFRPDPPSNQVPHPVTDDAATPASALPDNGKAENSAEPAIYVPFIDFKGFDTALAEKIQLAGPRPIEVSLYVPATPNSLPDRLEKWLAAVNEGGGQVRVVRASPELGVRSLGAGVGVVMELVTIVKKFSAAAKDRAIARSVREYDAELVLESSESGETVIRRVIFKKRSQIN